MQIQKIKNYFKNILIEQKCPGIVLGLSGTDSILSSILLAELDLNIPIKLIHFNTDIKNIDTKILMKRLQLNPDYLWIQRIIIPWLQTNYPSLEVIVNSDRHPLSEAGRYAELIDIALKNSHHFDTEQEKTFWICGTRNRTEDILGLYSNISNCVSLQPIISLYKTDVLKYCKDFQVPDIALKYSRMADCDCGRFDLASQNIESIDLMLQDIIPDIDYDLKVKLQNFINENLTENIFKKNIPYTYNEVS